MKKIIYLIFSLFALSAQAQQQTHPPKLTPAERIAVIDTLVAKVNALYVYEDLAKQMTAAILQHQQHHDYDTITNREVFYQTTNY